MWMRWAVGTGTTNDPEAGRPFEVEVRDFGMIELLPDTHTERYRFSADFQPTASTISDSWAGVYFAFQQVSSGPSTVADRALVARFRDNLISNQPGWSTGNQLNVTDVLIARDTAAPFHRHTPPSVGTVKVREEHKTSDRPWRTIVAEVTPDQVRVWFRPAPHQPFTPTEPDPITAETLHAQIAKHRTFLALRPPHAVPDDMTYTPRGRLGLFAQNVKVYFRNVVFDPTPSPHANP
jgi:hypothetical protein